jgi:hypothetical protein
MAKSKQLAYGLDVPLNADSVDSPIVQYGGGMTALHFTTEDGRWGRVTFERLDSIKVSRGEYEPFPSAPGEGKSSHWVTTVSNSEWLRERYDYEKRHYGNAYNFGGDVDEMVREFSHYVFNFHDQFVEVLAAGIWFESSDAMLGARDPEPGHPLAGLAHLGTSETFEGSGITCHVRRNPLPDFDIDHLARLCSQPILEIGAELEGCVRKNWTLTRRVLHGIARSHLRAHLGTVVESYEHIPTLAEIRPHIEKWLAEVHQRRKAMGKA